MIRALAVLGVVAACPTAAWACASCACGDPTLTSVGLEKPFTGRLRLSSTFQYRTEAEGLRTAPEEQSGEARLDLAASYALTRRFVLAARVPMLRKDLHLASGKRQSATGLGDVELLARAVMWQDSPTLATHVLSLQPALIFPTSPTARFPDGTKAPLSLQTGRGSWIPTVGLSYGYFGVEWAVFASTSVQVPLGARFGEQSGVTALATVVGQYQPLDWLAAQLGADARYSRPNQQGRYDVPDTGGGVVFLSPGVAVSPGLDWLVQVVLRLPLWRENSVRQREGPIYLLAVAYDVAT